MTLEARATPVRDTTAYLYARFENDGGLILPGEAALSRDGLFVGCVQLEAISPGAEGAVPFGPIETTDHADRRN